MSGIWSAGILSKSTYLAVAADVRKNPPMGPIVTAMNKNAVLKTRKERKMENNKKNGVYDDCYYSPANFVHLFIVITRPR